MLIKNDLVFHLSFHNSLQKTPKKLRKKKEHPFLIDSEEAGMVLLCPQKALQRSRSDQVVTLATSLVSLHICLIIYVDGIIYTTILKRSLTWSIDKV